MRSSLTAMLGWTPPKGPPQEPPWRQTSADALVSDIHAWLDAEPVAATGRADASAAAAAQPIAASRSGPSSGYTRTIPGFGRQQEAARTGKNGGEIRHGNSGGSNRQYYRGYYSAKGRGKAALAEYLRMHGDPPGSGGKGYMPKSG